MKLYEKICRWCSSSFMAADAHAKLCETCIPDPRTEAIDGPRSCDGCATLYYAWTPERRAASLCSVPVIGGAAVGLSMMNWFAAVAGFLFTFMLGAMVLTSYEAIVTSIRRRER